VRAVEAVEGSPDAERLPSAAGQGPLAEEQPAPVSAAPPARVDGYVPISSYAAIGDGRTIALVASDGSIDWLPIPGLDDPPVFGALLDPARSGCFELAPAERFEVSRRYLKNTNVLESTFTTAGGAVTVTDSLNLQDGGELSWVELTRRVCGVRGRVRMRYRVVPRFDFGLDHTRLSWRGEALIATQDARTMGFRVWRDGERPCPREDRRLSAGELAGELDVRAGEEALLVCVLAHEEPLPLPPRREIEIRLRRTAEAWRRWIDFHSYDGPWREEVTRSLLALKLLINAHRGAIVAAPTTSLPERIGGQRNYDYRYAWVRDSAFTLDALGAAGYREQVHASLCFILQATRPTHPRLEPFYALAGGVPRGEQELALAGYRGSRPVRKGNSAGGQLQLGCYGNLLETIELYVRHGNTLDEQTRTRVGEVADHVCRIWHNEDSGIWELFELHHYTLSKIHCWVALDRAIKLAELGETSAAGVERWRAEAQRIHAWVDAHCWSEAKRSYAFHAGSEDLDAGVLLAVRAGFLAPDHPRLRSTVRAIRRELSAGGPLLYRYSGQQDCEAAFLPCSFWLVEALARMGELQEACSLMEALLELSNDVGLYSEEIDPVSGELLGNFPQGLTHLALVNAALTIAKAQEEEAQ
jgi:GH15 family glucan-1,4-alpha-glucosidase